MPRKQVLALLIASREKLNQAIKALGGPANRGRPRKMATEDSADIQDLLTHLRSSAELKVTKTNEPTKGVGSLLVEQERLLIRQALKIAGNNQSEAARILRIGRDELRYKIKKDNLGKKTPR
jgi:DNA-binding NtrC family response regulator